METVAKKQSVLIVDNDTERIQRINQLLNPERYPVVATVNIESNLHDIIFRENPDIILIGVETPDENTITIVDTISSNCPRPIVMFAKDERSETIRKVTRAGVSAYAVGSLSKERMVTIIKAAVARFSEFQALLQELEKTKTTLEERKTIERAKEIVAQQRGTSEAEAYKVMRKMAMDQRKRLAEIAKEIISIAEVFTKKKFQL